MFEKASKVVAYFNGKLIPIGLGLPIIIWIDILIHSYWKWDIVCDNGAQRQLSKSLVLAGKMVGSMICGQLADVVGRKKAFTLAILLMVGIGRVHVFGI